MDLDSARVLARYDERRVLFDGTMNCRDLGGLPIEGGGITAKGRVYRSGRLSNLMQSDLERFVALGLKQISDLRLPFEREKYPDSLPHGCDAEEYQFGYLPERADAMIEAINQGQISPDGILATMREQYADMAIGHPEIHAQLFRALIKDDSTPALFHCSGGKDRTGVAAALLQRIAGVGREIVIADYLVTNLDTLELGVFDNGASSKLLDVVGRAHAELIASALSAVENNYDSSADYVRAGLGFSEQEYDRLVGLLRGPD
ncbi:MAG: tyrosine-protein phosphatase [Pseudomonadota bacterium]